MRRVLLPLTFLLLAWAFWASPHLSDVAAGVAIFLFGMIALETGFKAFTGGTLEAALRHSTDRLWKSIGFGIASTTLMQSSTLVSLVTISFVSAEMISLAAGIGVIMGANLGTTTGAWLIAGFGLRVDIAAYAAPMLVFGVILLLNRNRMLKGIGYLFLGVGFLFLGIHFMKEGFEAFQEGFDLAAYAVPGLAGVLLFTAIGMLMTVVMQSSHATLLVIIAALAAGQVTYDNALALAIGANLGSAITTAAGGMAANLGGRRLAVAHVLFNVMTAAVAILLIEQMGWAVDRISGMVGIADDDYLLKLALFHTLFNLLGVAILTPFVRLLERELIRRVRLAPRSAEQPRYLYSEALKTPATAVTAVRREVGHLFDNAHGLIAHGLSLRRAVINSDRSLTEAVRNTRRIMPLDVDDAYEQNIKSLHSAIVAFIGEVHQRELSEHWTNRLYALQQASRDIVEAVKGMKHLHKNLVRYGTAFDPMVRRHYDALRLQLARLLREIGQLRNQEPGAATSLSLDSLRLSLETSHRKLVGNINQAIRDRQLSAHIATSLMNDEAYAYTIAENLIEAAHALLVSDEPADHVAEEHLALDPQEIKRMAGNTMAHPQPGEHADEDPKTS
ncbi:Na/Pi cotransporter family protein [Thioalkalivibrio paradoxus]|uniref:Sodium:phosphate symporter n=1 Tax=Thioalkalivibrio paradoxus ARh 1 TaxID=713585 RepID=W0DMA1_9GAMM|nr:Na/Pi symporter [Thioalkalivibrio paradoxus]AHE98020.1 sodium:phosphate symporter [Thioalkalivibrio paradoxus ARh 1]